MLLPAACVGEVPGNSRPPPARRCGERVRGLARSGERGREDEVSVMNIPYFLPFRFSLPHSIHLLAVLHCLVAASSSCTVSTEHSGTLLYHMPVFPCFVILVYISGNSVVSQPHSSSPFLPYFQVLPVGLRVSRLFVTVGRVLQTPLPRQ